MHTHFGLRSGFTLRDMLIGVAAIGLLLLLALPAVRAAQEAARRNRCIDNLKHHVLAMHNYHDVHKQLPNITSTGIRGVAPASLSSEDSSGSGYHWFVSILPYLGEKKSFDQMERASNGFTLSPFDPAVKSNTGNTPSAASNFASLKFDFSRCPSQRGSQLTNAPEFAASGPNSVAAFNYVALSATHLDCMLGDRNAGDYIVPNGVLIPGPTIVTFRSIVDGTSRTLILVETRERNYTSWYDGTVGWVVAGDTNAPKPIIDSNGSLKPHSGSSSALNVGPSSANPNRFYLPTALHSKIAIDWEWGPSSEHVGGVITHAIADGSARSLTDDIDTQLYMQLVTRAGREPANCCEDEP
jgi:competence protein ComGC